MKKKLSFITAVIFACIFSVVCSEKANAELPDPNSLSYTKLAKDPFDDRLWDGQLLSIWQGGHYYGNGIDNGKSSYEFGTNLNVSWARFDYTKIILALDGELDTQTNYAYPTIFYNSKSYSDDLNQRAQDGLIEVNLYRRIKNCSNEYEFGYTSIRDELFKDNRITFFREKKYRNQLVVERVNTLNDANRIEIDLGDYLKDNDLAISIPWIATSLTRNPYAYPADKKEISTVFSSTFEAIDLNGNYLKPTLYRAGTYFR